MPPRSRDDEFNVKQSRLDNPSGWIQLTRYETVRLLIDALIESPPEYEFNKSELERRTGLSREAIRQHLPLLVDLGIVKELDRGEWAKFQLNDDGKVTKELFELNSAVNSVLSGEPKNMQEGVEILATLRDFSDSQGTRKIDKLPKFYDVDNSGRDDDGDLIDQPPAATHAINAD